MDFELKPYKDVSASSLQNVLHVVDSLTEEQVIALDEILARRVPRKDQDNLEAMLYAVRFDDIRRVQKLTSSAE